MEINRGTAKKILGIVAFGVLLLVLAENFSSVSGVAISIFKLFTPFLLGGCIAFIINVPMNFFERLIFGRGPAFNFNKNMHSDSNAAIKPKNISDKNKKNTRSSSKSKQNTKATYPRWNAFKDKISRPVSLILAFLFIVAVIFIVIFLIVPELTRTFSLLATNIQRAWTDIIEWSTQFFKDNPTVLSQIDEWSNSIDISNWSKIGDTIFKWLASSGSQVISSTFGVATSIVGGVVNFFVGLFFSFYLLVQKEKLARQAKQILFSFLPEKIASKTVSIGSMANKTFSSFLSGQCLEAVIIGVMFFIVLSIFKFDYALMISVLIAFTALIPVFGAFIGCFVGAFLFLMTNPIQALWFVIIFLVIQQLEGNFIYPYVVGGSVGLPSIWVLVAVTVGGSAMGVLGMLVFIPISSVLYALLRELVYYMLNKKNIPDSKWDSPSPSTPPNIT